MKKVIEKCRNQKTISTHLVLKALENAEKRYKHLEQKHKETQHYANKHKQMMRKEIQQLKAVNKKLKERNNHENSNT